MFKSILYSFGFDTVRKVIFMYALGARSHFYIQLLYRPHFGTWNLPFGLLGCWAGKGKYLKRRNFCLSMQLLGVFFSTFWGQKKLFFRNILAPALKSYMKWLLQFYICFWKSLKKLKKLELSPINSRYGVLHMLYSGLNKK